MADKDGMRAIGTAITQLADDPYPSDAFHRDDYQRLRAGPTGSCTCVHWPCVLRDLPVQVGELEDLRDERVADLERGLLLAGDAELHGATGGRALRDRERRAGGPAEERQPDPAAEGRRA